MTRHRNIFRFRNNMKNQLANRRRGAAAVEFAVTAPILFAFLFAAMEFGLANMMFHTTEAAAYEAARVAMIPGATAQEADTAARRVLATARVFVADIQIAPTDLQTETDTVAVTISVNFRDNTTLVPFFMGNQPFVKTCELTREKLN